MHRTPDRILWTRAFRAMPCLPESMGRSSFLTVYKDNGIFWLPCTCLLQNPGWRCLLWQFWVWVNLVLYNCLLLQGLETYCTDTYVKILRTGRSIFGYIPPSAGVSSVPVVGSGVAQPAPVSSDIVVSLSYFLMIKANLFRCSPCLYHKKFLMLCQWGGVSNKEQGVRKKGVIFCWGRFWVRCGLVWLWLWNQWLLFGLLCRDFFLVLRFRLWLVLMFVYWTGIVYVQC